MNTWGRVLVATMVTLAMSACSGSGTDDSSTRGASCAKKLDRVMSLIRAGEKGNGHDALTVAIQELGSGGCSAQWKTFADYSSSRSMAKAVGVDSCGELARYRVKPAAIQLLRQDGLCKGRLRRGRETAPAVEAQPGGGISWDEARRHIGTTQRVCGPLAGSGQSSDDVFLNLGVDYPDPERFTVVLWDVGSVRPPPGAKVLCVSGLISEYRGVPQIELRSIQAVDTYR